MSEFILNKDERVYCSGCREYPRVLITYPDEEDAVYCGNCGFITDRRQSDLVHE